jgi:hypothetical protein
MYILCLKLHSCQNNQQIINFGLYRNVQASVPFAQNIVEKVIKFSFCSVVLGTSTRSRSRPEFSGGSRPNTGRDPEKKSGRDPDRKSGCDRGLRSRSGRDFFSFYYSHRKDSYTNRSNRPIGLKIY